MPAAKLVSLLKGMTSGVAITNLRFWNLKIVSDAWSVVSSRMCEIPFWEALAAALNPEGPEPTIAISNSSLIC